MLDGEVATFAAVVSNRPSTRCYSWTEDWAQYVSCRICYTLPTFWSTPIPPLFTP